ncbi:MAG: molybdopterin-dependent oxidoreductase [Gammaproteobacteria bacterium]|uniref:molybdopterin-containing oxidoreductase family protein n=1 Tax=Rhodoferax sp. TaxID=50421 RepID=UPI0018498EAD|nr:molybdopterin-dependent oxidoreductase [Rhodoferax sp.]MBU3900860.1 molybdopterin-dependent oxidoreductase [Gammaproteobacteria bacterium]MBA3058650.1 molybdopterin-dependent oxidoreductase [Rhodoferax sp.]MBU3998367.1 molybdopterin-dependent oxidoreductase [Gammaproteobacteria bacterium]MBU4082214.1 molybdopterin-dependent oxidoreductase [Gammaproteobacteria bacterium]MBU4112764.1 molybdopterin-dependent oxidoreductase [Gammaproteobacteria bacterium]
MEFNVSRRTILRSAGAFASTAALGGGGLLALTALAPREAQAMRIAAGSYQIRYTADTMCPAECGMEMWVKNGQVAKIYGNKAVPMNDGACCAKGAAGQQLIYSPFRLKQPLIRVGERGEGKFRVASWEEAVDVIAKKLTAIKKTYGAESIVMDAGDVTDRDQYYRLFFAYGTPNCSEHGAICDTPRRHGPRLMLGGKRIEPDIMRPQLVRQPDGSLKQDFTYRTKLIIYNGWNPFVATRIPYESRGTVAAMVEAGCKVVVIDPSLSNTAAKADMWLAPRAGTDGDLFGAMLRFILENDNQNDPNRKYIDWNFKKYSVGWEDFEPSFKSWWAKSDPVNGLSYFGLDWAANRTGLAKEKIAELAHMFGITKPAALVWGMQSPGHHFNGYCCSIIGTVLNVITGNFDVPGGVIDTELVKSDKGGSATGKQFKSRKVKRVIAGKEVEGEVEHLHMDLFGSKYPAGWDEVVADYPNAMMDGVDIRYGPFRGLKYPMKAYVLRTGNSVYTGSAPYKWKDAITAKDKSGNYKLDLFVFIDTLYLESALYADVILPEASYVERQSLADIYPSSPVMYNRDAVIAPMHECKKPTEIMNLLAKRLAELGDKDMKGSDFWEKYRTEEDFVNEMLEPSPGRPNIGTPLPYPQYPEGYKLVGTPDSLERGEGKINHDKKEVRGKPVTVEWLRANKGVAIWPMSWQRYKKVGSDEPNKVFPNTSTKLIEFKFDWTEGGKRFGGYAKYNEKLEKAGGEVPLGLKRVGFDKFPSAFFWFETVWNPHTNVDYQKYAKEYPFQLICGKVHHAMSGTQMVPWLGEVTCEGTWQPLNDAFEALIPEAQSIGPDAIKVIKHKFPANSFSVGTVWMNDEEAQKLKLKTGDLVEVTNPLGKHTRGKIFTSGGMRPGVIKMGFGAGGRFSPGMGPAYESRKYTPLHNELMDPDAMSPIMGFPAYADMVVKVRKV